MTHLIVFTATYGTGEPPYNAKKFYKRWQDLKEGIRPFQYAVLGFGSKSYPDFCAFAYKVNEWLSWHASAHELLPLQTVDNRSVRTIDQWIRGFGEKLNLVLDPLESKREPPMDLQVKWKASSPNELDATFLLRLFATKGKIKNYESGDLLSIVPEGDSRERLYSATIEKDKRSLLLSIRIHPFGLCSNYLANLKPGDVIKGRLKKNDRFHFPSNGKPVVMIANGTGMVPFLGMLDDNKKRSETTLFWGGQNAKSLQLYQKYLDRALDKRKLSRLLTAYSRTPDGHYVQEVIKRNPDAIVDTLSNDGIIMICGSKAMQKGVCEILDEICTNRLGCPFTHYIDKGLLKEDCY